MANLVLDGADGIVLGSETFRGKFPVSTAETVTAICVQAERTFDSFAYYFAATEAAGMHSLNPVVSKVGACGCGKDHMKHPPSTVRACCTGCDSSSAPAAQLLHAAGVSTMRCILQHYVNPARTALLRHC